MKPLLTALLSVASASSSRRIATAQTLEQENEVDKILVRMENEAMALRNELEDAYKKRCVPDTNSSCRGKNYNDCWSSFPNQQCMFCMPHCGDSPTRCDGEGGCKSCFGESTKPNSKVTTPDCKGEFLQCLHLVIIC